ncbi:serine-threonine protein kinase 19-domain-containing protein [Xylogone sp. PMI_703]|nr:serine-threonine protein kinase 19-domain-containing protein [Xylogone sp. PMI_703]
MSLRFSAAHSSRIRKSGTKSSSSIFKRTSSTPSPYASLPRRKPLQKLPSSKSKSNKNNGNTNAAEEDEVDGEEGGEEDFFNDRLDDIGLVKALATDLLLRDVAQAIMYIRDHTWNAIPEQRSGMNSTRTAEVLNFRRMLPPIVTVSHVHALLNSATKVEREIAQLIREGVVRKIVVGGRGHLGEVLVLVKDLEELVGAASGLDEEVRDKFLGYLRENQMATGISMSFFSVDEAKSLMHAGFLTASTPAWTSTDVFSQPGDGSRGTLTSLNAISKAASGTLAAVGGEGAVHAVGGTGGRKALAGTSDFSLALPGTGPFLKLLASARTHLVSLLSKSRFRELPETLLRQRWDGNSEVDNAMSAAKRSRGEFAGILPGRTRKWKMFYGMRFEYVLEECVGAGLVEVFDTRSIGRGVRAL